MHHSQDSTQVEDLPLKTTAEPIEPNPQHKDNVYKIIEELAKQLQFEQERNLRLQKDNTELQDQIQLLRSKPAVQIQSTHTQTEFYQKELEQLNTKEDSQLNICSNLYSDNDPVTSQESPANLDDINPKKPDLRIDVNCDPQPQHSAPNSNVKKSQTYLQGLTNIKLRAALTDGIPQKTNRISQNNGEKNTQLRKSLQHNFQSNKSSITDIDHLEGQELQGNSFGNQQCIDSIEENRIETQEVSVLQQPTLNLYEQFYILGCEKKEFGEFEQDPNIKEGILYLNHFYAGIIIIYLLFISYIGKIINFDLISQTCIYRLLSISSKYEAIINGFVYPFGNQVQKIKPNNQFEKLKEIIYSCNKYELLDKFQVFAIKNHDNHEDFVEYTNQKLMFQANPEKLLYGICLTVDDYVETTPDHIVTNFENRKDRVFWKYKKTYCFLTYFPFYELFQDLLISIIQLIKFNRSNRWMMNVTEENEVPKQIDGQQIILEFQDELTKFLNEIQAIKPVQGHQLLEVQTLASLLKYKIPNQQQLDIDLRLWSANITLQVLNYNEILTIFLAMISEISIIFTSQNGSILTSIVHFFHHLIRPLEWTQKIIYNVSEQLLTLIQSPVPVIIGVNLPETDFQQLELTSHCNNHLFVFLDRDKENKFLHMPSTVLEQIPTPSFGGLLQKIEETLENQNNLRSLSPSKRHSNKFDVKKAIKFYFDENDQRTSNTVLECFKKIINDYIISKLPPNDEEVLKQQEQAQKVLDVGYIKFTLTYGNEPKDRKFIEKLFETHYFQYFVQQHYEAQM